MYFLNIIFIACVDVYEQLSVYRNVIPFLPKHVEYTALLILQNFVLALIIQPPFHDFPLQRTETGIIFLLKKNLLSMQRRKKKKQKFLLTTPLTDKS